MTIHDARRISPGAFSETGFTLVTLDEVYSSVKCVSVSEQYFSKEPKTKNWRYNSEDIHLFHEMMNPYLRKLYPQTKVNS